MGKVSPKDRESMTPKQKRRLKNLRNRYLRPGDLAQLRYNRAGCSKSCTDLGKKRVAVLDSGKRESDSVLKNKVIDQNPSMLSPERIGFCPVIEPMGMLKQNKLPRTPKTPHADDYQSDSRLESLPTELLVKILCHLHHDQLRAVFHVSQKIRNAVLIARQFHFNYTTPDRSRQEMLRMKTPLPTDHWPFVSNKGDGKKLWVSSPHTPKAPRHGARPPRLNMAEMRQIAAVLFQESAFPSRCKVPPGLPKPLCKSLASNRVLFYEDELCQAVAQNKLR